MRYSVRLGNSIRILVGVSAAVIVLGLNAPPASAQDGNPAIANIYAPSATTDAQPAPKAKAAQSSGKSYFVEFRARAAQTYGHMYVLYGQVNGRNEIIKSDIAGHHPAGDSSKCENCSVFNWSIGHFLFVPAELGASDGDLEEKYVTARYRIMLDAASYQKVAAYIAKMKADPPLWNALWRNCVKFGNGIAELVNLKTPSMIWLEPKEYVEGLRHLNAGPKQGPLKFAASGGSAKTSAAARPNSAPPAPPAAPATSSAPQKTSMAVSATAATSSTPQKPKKQAVTTTPEVKKQPAAKPDVAAEPAYGTPQ